MAFDLEEKRLLKKTLMLREQMIDALSAGGIPKNNEDIELLLKLVDSTDRTIHSKARLKIEEEGVRNEQQIRELVARVLSQDDTTPARERDIPQLPSELTRTKQVEGDTTIGPSEETYESFIKRFE